MSASDLARRLGALRAQFLEGLPGRVAEIDAWLASEDDVSSLVRLAHRLRGVAPSHGLVHLGTVAARVEDSCRGASRVDAIGGAHALRDAIDEAIRGAAPSTPVIEEVRAPAIAARPLEGWRVVAVDDDPVMRRLLELTLTGLGGAHAVVTASPAELLAELRRGVADLVISDLMMPLENGPSLLVRAGAEGLLAGARVVLLSAAGPSDVDARDAFDIDPRWVWMAKPFRPPELVRALAALRSSPASM